MHAPSGLTSALVARLYEQANARRWEIARERFEAALAASLGNARAGSPSIDAERYFSALHLEDLALAVACADGHEPAWNHFVAEHRAPLGRAAMAIDPAGGADLADSLYADLFGLQVKAGDRQSLFRYFHGRSKLGTWLRAVMSQRHIDRIRVARRHEPLPDEEDSGATAMPALADSGPPAAERGRFLHAMRESLATAIGALAARDRLRLSSYYTQDMKLAAIGKMMGEHEATVSRQLARTRAEIRAAVEARLRSHHGLDAGALGECFESVTEDAGALDLAELFGRAPARKNGPLDRSRK